MLGISIWDWFSLGLYFIGITWLGVWTMKRIKSAGDFFMGGRRFGKVMMIAQAFGVGTHTDQPVSVSGASYTNGLAGIWYQWIYMFATPFYWIIAPIYRRLRYITMADFFEERYGNKMAILYTSVALLYFSMNMGVMLKGTAITVEGLTGAALSEELIIIVCTALFLTYGLAGGIIAAVFTDLIQGILILVLSFILIPYALHAAGGLSTIKEGLPEYMFSLVAPSEVTFFFIVMAVINGLIGVVVLPHHMAIGGSGKTEFACRSGWTYGNFLKRFATAGWAFIGIFAAFLFPEFIGSDRELTFGIASRELLPVGLVGLMLAAMLAAVMSTCDAFMVHASALFTNNLYKPYLRPEASDKELLLVGRWASIGVVAGGLLFAYGFPSVIAGIKEAWKITAYMGFAFWIGVIWPGANRYGAFSSAVIMALVGIYTQIYLGWSFPYQVATYIPIGLVVMISVSLLTKREPQEKLDAFYTLLDTPIGQESRLHKKGIEIKLTGALDHDQAKNAKEIEDGLILVDLRKLHRAFSWRRYRTDILGFATACLIAMATVLVVYLIAIA